MTRSTRTAGRGDGARRDRRRAPMGSFLLRARCGARRFPTLRRSLREWLVRSESGGPLTAALDYLLQGGNAGAVAEIAEALARGTRAGEQREQRVERVGEAGDVEPLGDRLVEPSALEIAADIERVEPRHPADNADVAAVGPGAAVRAASDADAEPLAFQAPALEPRRDRADDVLTHPLGLGQRQAAAR